MITTQDLLGTVFEGDVVVYQLDGEDGPRITAKVIATDQIINGSPALRLAKLSNGKRRTVRYCFIVEHNGYPIEKTEAAKRESEA